MWTADINEMFTENKPALSQIYNDLKGEDRQLSVAKIRPALIHQVPTENDFILCYALSKYTVQNETLKGQHITYDAIQYLEFLELICRVAVRKF